MGRARRAAPLLPLLAAARYREVQAVIVLQTTWDRLKWQSKLPVPTAFQGSAELPNNVTVNIG